MPADVKDLLESLPENLRQHVEIIDVTFIPRFILTSDEDDQGWIDSFNNWGHTDYYLHEEFSDAQEIDELNDKIEEFNFRVAHGPALALMPVLSEP